MAPITIESPYDQQKHSTLPRRLIHRTAKHRITILLLTSFLLGILTASATAQNQIRDRVSQFSRTQGSTRIESSNAEIFRRVMKSVVWINWSDGKAGSAGTGWLVDKEQGLIVTNQHVVAGTDEVWLYYPEYESGRLITDQYRYLDEFKPVPATVISADADLDLALIQVEYVPNEMLALELAATSAEPTESVHSIGNPAASGALWVYTQGSVRTVYRQEYQRADGRPVDRWLVETDSPINFGDSGGPVVNSQGELVAVVMALRTDARLVSYFIDVRTVREFLNDRPRPNRLRSNFFGRDGKQLELEPQRKTQH